MKRLNRVKPGVRADDQATARGYLELKTPREIAASKKPIDAGAPPTLPITTIPEGVPVTGYSRRIAGFKNLNAWFSPPSLYGPHEPWVVLYAEYRTTDTRQGAVLRDGGGALQLPKDHEIVDAPIQGDPARILLRSHGVIVVIQLADRATLRYNVRTGRFLDPPK